MTETGKVRLEEQPRVPMSRSTRLVLIGFLILLVVLGAGNLLSGYLQYRHFTQVQKQAGEIVEQRLCATLVSLAALKPPAGNGTDNPSRLYEQKLQAKLAELSTDIECQAAQ
jgi:hypothetical protein